MAAITITRLGKSYGAVKVLEGLDLSVEQGEFLTLLGPSGCGKTTTLRCIAGLETPTAGSIQIGSDLVVDMAKGSVMPPNKRDLGMVFQSYALWPHMSVAANVAYPLKVRGRPRDEIRRNVIKALDLVGLAHLADRQSSALSGGQQQRIALARALAAEPRVLLLDEPLSNLDAALRGQMRRELRRIHREVARTSVYVTHDQLEAATLSDRIVVMNAGKIEQLGTPSEIFGRPATPWVAQFIGFENLLTGRVQAAEGRSALLGIEGWAEPLRCHWTGADLPQSGQTACVAIRASAFQTEPTPGAARIEARLVDAMFVGDQTEYLLEIAGTTLTCRLLADAASFGAPGQSVSLYIAPGQAVAMRQEP